LLFDLPRLEEDCVSSAGVANERKLTSAF
jgi:hypothetical protein